ncbi:MAG: AAA family ATPase [Actinomycetota bacterium]|nr:AAA family ATPase [Actinomycetota bacterium]
MDPPQRSRRRSRDPYAESFRERHTVGINAFKRWTKRILFVAALYGLYLLAIWLIFPWGETTPTPTGPARSPEFSIAAANGFIPRLLLSLIGPIFYFAFIVFIVVFQFVAIFWFLSRGRTYVIYPGEYDINFDDVRGQKAAVEATQEVVKLFQGFKKFRKMGGYPPQGILLEGPPGTGKTLLSKAIAGEVNVPFIYASASSFNNMFMGVANLRVMRLFTKARKFSERFGGAVIFMDELDAVGSRGGVPQTMEPYPFDEPFRHGLEDRLVAGTREEPRQGGILGFVDRFFVGGMGGMGGMLVNELLVQMDGLEQPRGLRRFLRRLIPLKIRKHLKRKVPNYNILVIGATNRADALDPALLRPGRFDRRLHVGLPDKEGRKDIADYYLRKVRHEDIDREKFAKATVGYSPARIKNVVNEALIFALQDGRDSLSWKDIWAAKLTDEIGLKQPVEYDEEEKVKIATHEAGHAVASWYLEREELQMQVISIIKRENALGLVSYQEREDRYVRTRSDVTARIKTALAAGAAENVWFGETTTGVSGDLRQATWAAATMVGLFGMGKELYSFGTIPNELAGGSSIGAMLRDTTVREEVNEILLKARKEIEDLLRDKSTIVEGVRDALLEREEIIGEEIDRLFARLEARGEPQGSGVV